MSSKKTVTISLVRLLEPYLLFQLLICFRPESDLQNFWDLFLFNHHIFKNEAKCLVLERHWESQHCVCLFFPPGLIPFNFLVEGSERGTGVLLSTFCRWVNWDSEPLTNVHQATQLVNSQARARATVKTIICFPCSGLCLSLVFTPAKAKHISWKQIKSVQPTKWKIKGLLNCYREYCFYYFSSLILIHKMSPGSRKEEQLLEIKQAELQPRQSVGVLFCFGQFRSNVPWINFNLENFLGIVSSFMFIIIVSELNISPLESSVQWRTLGTESQS